VKAQFNAGTAAFGLASCMLVTHVLLLVLVQVPKERMPPQLIAVGLAIGHYGVPDNGDELVAGKLRKGERASIITTVGILAGTFAATFPETLLARVMLGALAAGLACYLTWASLRQYRAT